MNELCEQLNLVYKVRLTVKFGPFNIIAIFREPHVLTGRYNQVVWQYVPKAGLFQQ